MIEAHVDVAAPKDLTYRHWTQYETFPLFMEGVESVEEVEADTLRWRVEVAGATREFVTDVVTRDPGACVAWESREGQGHSGTVRFRDLREGGTRVELAMDYELSTWTDRVARALNLVDMRVKDDLRRFKAYVEHGTAPS